MDLAIKGQTIERLDQAPGSRIGLTLRLEKLRRHRPFLNQNGTDLNGWWHKSSREANGQGRVSAVTAISNSEANISVLLLISTISLNRSGFIRSSGCILFPSPRGSVPLRPALTSCPFTGKQLPLRIRRFNVRAREPPYFAKLRIKRR